MSRLRRDEGFVMPAAMALLVIFLLLTGVALTTSLQSLDRSNRDRRQVRALQAADAGVDVAVRRMNRMLLSSDVADALGVAPSTLRQLGCMRVDAAAGGHSLTVLAAGQQWCSAQPDPPATLRGGTTYAYMISNGVTVTTALGDLLERRILSVGTAGDVQRRVLVHVRLALLEDPNELAIFKRVRHVECTARPPDPAVPASGCPGA